MRNNWTKEEDKALVDADWNSDHQGEERWEHLREMLRYEFDAVRSASSVKNRLYKLLKTGNVVEYKSSTGLDVVDRNSGLRLS